MVSRRARWLVLVLASCTSTEAVEDEPVKGLEELVYERYDSLSNACTVDRDCVGVGIIFAADSHTCFNDCELALAAQDAAAFRAYVKEDHVQALCASAVAPSSCAVSSPACIHGACTVPQYADRAACNAEVIAVYAAVDAFEESVGADCAEDSDCTKLYYQDIPNCGFECGRIVSAAHADDIMSFINTDPTIAQHCQVAHDAGCLALRGGSCPAERAVCREAKCVRAWPEPWGF
jgi:hypothetical protein